MYVNVFIAMFLTNPILVSMFFLALYATPGLRISQGMSWQHLH